MKTKQLHRIMMGAFILAMVCSGCKKEEPVPEFKEFAFDTEEVMAKLPDALINSQDDEAQACVDAIETAVDMSSFMANMTPPENASRTGKKASGDTWSWTWSYGGFSYTFYWTYEEDNTKNYWNMEIQFGDGPRCDYITAWEMQDGSGGQLQYNFAWVNIYEGSEEYEDFFWTYTWDVDANDNYNFHMYWDSSESGCEHDLDYDIGINANGSGYVNHYLQDVLWYEAEWDAAGNGSWAYHFGDYNTSGSWTAK